MLTLTEPNSRADEFGGSIDRLLAAFTRLTKSSRWKRAIPHRFRALEVRQPDNDISPAYGLQPISEGLD